MTNPATTRTKPAQTLALAVLVAVVVPTGLALGQPAGGLEFADWSTVGSNTASGALVGRPITLAGTHVSPPPGSVVDGSSTVFADSNFFSPSLTTSDAIEIQGFAPAYSYTLDLGAPTPNPVLHLASLGSTLEFPAGTEITKLSGESTLTISGQTVSGVAANATDDSHGTVRLTGVFSTVSFTAAYGGPSPDGIFLQVGADFAPPETEITVGPPDGTVVGDAAPVFEFASSEPGSHFECRAYDPAKLEPNMPQKVFQPCASPFQPNAESVELGEQTLFEVRAIDSSGNVDPSPASRLYVKHGELGKPPTKSKCDPVPLDQVLGKKVQDNCRIAEIVNGRVPCIQVNTSKAAKCGFSKRNGRWLRSKTGREFAVVGDPIARGKSPKGKYVIAVPIGEKKESPCAETGNDQGAGRDTAGAAKSNTLSGTCSIEALGSAWNGSGQPLDNHATRTVCMNNWQALAADLASAIEVPSPQPGVRCFYGEGAGLNDINGAERNSGGAYLPGTSHCHVTWSNGVEIYAAKRPATTGWPATVNPNSPSVWRPVAPRVNIAN